MYTNQYTYSIYINTVEKLQSDGISLVKSLVVEVDLKVQKRSKGFQGSRYVSCNQELHKCVLTQNRYNILLPTSSVYIDTVKRTQSHAI